MEIGALKAGAREEEKEEHEIYHLSFMRLKRESCEVHVDVYFDTMSTDAYVICGGERVLEEVFKFDYAYIEYKRYVNYNTYYGIAQFLTPSGPRGYKGIISVRKAREE